MTDGAVFLDNMLEAPPAIKFVSAVSFTIKTSRIMFKSLIAFCLSRRAIVVLGLVLFAGGGLLLSRCSISRRIRTPRP